MVLRRAAATSLVLAAVLQAVLGYAVFGPYALAHPPGPDNPGFAWYMLYHVTPAAVPALVVLLLVAAWRVWRTAGR